MSDSDARDCNEHNGSIDSVNYRATATGDGCNTTAQLDTIQGALLVYFRTLQSKVCGVSCLRLTHGGTGTGYLTLAPEGTGVSGYYCGDANFYGACVSGGNRNL